jgi:protein TonB
VGVNGDIYDVKILKGVHKIIDDAALKAVHTIPVLKPAMQDGEPVKLKYTVPVNFMLSNNRKS